MKNRFFTARGRCVLGSIDIVNATKTLAKTVELELIISDITTQTAAHQTRLSKKIEESKDTT